MIFAGRGAIHYDEGLLEGGGVNDITESIAGVYLDDIRTRYRFYRDLGNRALSQTSEEDCFWTPEPESNNIATIVKHVSGNMRSRWTEFLTSDGEKRWRHRDGEFVDDVGSREGMLLVWKQGWECFFGALDQLSEGDLHRTVKIRGRPHSVIEALNRQLGHYAYHIGQIVFIAKLRRSYEWESLSIPRGESKRFNEQARSQSP